MSVKKKHTETSLIYYCTFTCYQWMSLFEITDFYDEIYKWFRILIKESIGINGYVIMPNHLHCLLYLPKGSKTIDKVVGNGKRFMAYETVDRLREQNNTHLLSVLKEGVSYKEKKKGKLHQVFQPSFDVKPCYSEWFIEQKLDYIHRNPVSGKWKLVEDYTDYLHSSAGFYECGRKGLIDIMHYKEVGAEYFSR
jgi:REP element-mobilizing transposase RayT